MFINHFFTLLNCFMRKEIRFCDQPSFPIGAKWCISAERLFLLFENINRAVYMWQVKGLFTNEAKCSPPSNKSTPVERETLALTVPRSLWLWKVSNWTVMGPRLLLLLIVLFSVEAKPPKCDKSEYFCMLWTKKSPWLNNLCRICGEDLRGRLLHLHLHKEGEKVKKTHFHLMFTFSQIQVETSL